MKPVFHLEPKYSVTMLTREEWTTCPRTPAVKGLVWFTDGSRTTEGTGSGVYWLSANRRLSISLEKHTTVFQAEVYAILAYVHEIETQDQPGKYVSICSDSQAALKALQAAKTTSTLVQQCQQALSGISTRHTVRLYWVPWHAGVRGNHRQARKKWFCSVVCGT